MVGSRIAGMREPIPAVVTPAADEDEVPRPVATPHLLLAEGSVSAEDFRFRPERARPIARAQLLRLVQLSSRIGTREMLADQRERWRVTHRAG